MATYRRSEALRRLEREKKRAARAGARKRLSPELFTPPTPEAYTLFRFIEDWNRGDLPSNDTLLKFFQSWETSPILAADARLSAAGLSLNQDLRTLGQLMCRVIRERNRDELIQRFIGHLRLSSRLLKPKSSKITIIDDPQKHRRLRIFGRKDAQLVANVADKRRRFRNDVRSLWSLGQLLVTSTDFRSVILELQGLAQKALQPEEVGGEPRAAIPRQEAPKETLRRRTSTKTRVMTQAVGGGEESPNLNELRARMHRTQEDLAKLQGAELAGEGPFIEIHTPANTSELQIGDVQEEEEHEYFEEPENVAFQDESPQGPTAFAQDRDRMVLEDAKKTFRRLATNESFKQALSEGYYIFTKMRHTTKAELSSGEIISGDLAYDANFVAAQRDFLKLAQRFADGRSVTPLIDSISRVKEDAAGDYELTDFFGDWQAFLTQCTTDAAYLDHEEYYRRGIYLLGRTREYADRKYRKLFRDIIDSWNQFSEGWRTDKLTTEIGSLLRRIIMQDLFGQAESGAGRGLLNFTLIQPDLLNDLRNFTLPTIIRSLHELPLPHMEIQGGGLFMTLDNVVIPASMFAPGLVDLRTSSHIQVAPKERFFRRRGAGRVAQTRPNTGPQTGRWYNGAHFVFSGLMGDINNVHFAVDRQAWPRLQDAGYCDVRVGGKRGLSLVLDLATNINAEQRQFHVEPVYVRVSLDKLRMRFRGLEHKSLVSMMRPLIQARLKRQIEEAIRDQVVAAIEGLDMIAARLVKGVQ